MISEVVLPPECLSANIAAVWSLVCMSSLMNQKIIALSELPVAKLAYKLFFRSLSWDSTCDKRCRRRDRNSLMVRMMMSRRRHVVIVMLVLILMTVWMRMRMRVRQRLRATSASCEDSSSPEPVIKKRGVVASRLLLLLLHLGGRTDPLMGR